MSELDLKPGNPLRVRCRTCSAKAGSPCDWSRERQRRPDFHGKRVRDGYQDRLTYGPPKIIEVGPQTLAQRRHRGHLRAEAWRKTRRETFAAKLGELPGVERALNRLERTAPDINTPAFWKRVWGV